MLIINGQFKENNQPFDLHGSSIFTTLRYQHNKPLLWRRHWHRLTGHAEYFGYKMPQAQEILALFTRHIKDKNIYKIRIIIKDKDYAVTIEPYALSNLFIYKGVKVIYSSIKVHPQFKHYKTTSYLPYIMALKEAQAHGAFEALMLDDCGHVVDGSRTSIMLVNDHAITVPKSGLVGCMREEVLQYAQNLGIKVHRAYLKKEDMVGQILLSNSLMGVIPVGPIKSPLAKELINEFCPQIF